jgi:hypothetical protein
VDQSGGDTCHHCKGDTWHADTTCVEGMKHGINTDWVDDRCGPISFLQVA